MRSSSATVPPQRVIRISGAFIVAALAIASLPVAFELGKRATERAEESVTADPLAMSATGRFLVEDLEGEAFLLIDQERDCGDQRRDCAYLVNGPTIRALDGDPCELRPSDLPTRTSRDVVS